MPSELKRAQAARTWRHSLVLRVRWDAAEHHHEEQGPTSPSDPISGATLASAHPAGKDLTASAPKVSYFIQSSSPVPRALLLWQRYLGKLQLSAPFIWAALSAWQVALFLKCVLFIPASSRSGSHSLAAVRVCSIAQSDSLWSGSWSSHFPLFPGKYGKLGLKLHHLGFFWHPISCGAADF